MEMPTDGRPRLVMAGPGARVIERLADVFGPAMRETIQAIDRTPPPISYGPISRGQFDRRRQKAYKGSAMAKRATRRGGNPARSGAALGQVML